MWLDTQKKKKHRDMYRPKAMKRNYSSHKLIKINLLAKFVMPKIEVCRCNNLIMNH